MIMNSLQMLASHGQSFWMDEMSRGLITSGRLARLVREDGLRGMTSNPTIFARAINSGDDYEGQLRELVGSGASAEDATLELMLTDIRLAADELREVHEGAGGHDGFISIEVPAEVAADTHATIDWGRSLNRQVGRPNVMIKVPATAAGIPAIEQLLYEGINVNITLMFSLRHYEEVASAFLSGLGRRNQEGLGVDGIASVASFFVSRVDTLVDGMLDERQSKASGSESQRLASLRGRAAVANAKVAYSRFLELFRGEPFGRLRSAAARPQRPLWASLGTKDPSYSDVKYVEALIGQDTVSTMPEATADAFRDHGRVAETLIEDLNAARSVVADLVGIGIDLGEVGDRLQEQGVRLFTESHQTMAQTVKERHTQLAAQLAARNPR
jgi:transaldolase / glucose-6-phosphate isomerase